MPNGLRHINSAHYALVAGFFFSYLVISMNRKQKKAKRLKATQHTKSQARHKPIQPVVFNRQSAEACLNQDDVFDVAVREVGKRKLKTKMIVGGLALWVIWILILIW